ncbi:hypothetical protein MCAMS1_01106 [biofilm metagenome]
MDSSGFASKKHCWLIGTTAHVYPASQLGSNCPGHDGLFARLLLIALTCSRHSGFVRFCKRRFDLFAVSTVALQSWCYPLFIKSAYNVIHPVQPGIAAAGVSYNAPVLSNAQATRAFLLARATAAMFLLRLAHKLCNHLLLGSVLSPATLSTDRAPWISKVRK